MIFCNVHFKHLKLVDFNDWPEKSISLFDLKALQLPLRTVLHVPIQSMVVAGTRKQQLGQMLNAQVKSDVCIY